MDELIGRLVVKIGIDNVVAKKAVGIMLGFLCNKGTSNKVQALIGKIPGAESVIAILSNNSGPDRLMRVA